MFMYIYIYIYTDTYTFMYMYIYMYLSLWKTGATSGSRPTHRRGEDLPSVKHGASESRHSKYQAYQLCAGSPGCTLYICIYIYQHFFYIKIDRYT